MAQYDLLVIGGGINGLGVATDAAARGLSVLLVEKGDFGGGTTSASSRLIHGGLRYLQFMEFDLVKESLHERGLLARQRPHLIHPIQLLIPTYAGAPLLPFEKSARKPGWMIKTGLLMYDQFASDPLFPPHTPLSHDETLILEPGLNPSRLKGGFVYPDAQVEFPERVCVELAQETVAAGGEVRNHTRVLSLTQEGSRVTGAVLHDDLTGETFTVEARMTINAGGPWVDVVNQTLAIAPPKMIGGTWGTHLILPRRPGGPQGPIYAEADKDARPFFLLPWDNRLLVGTTDVKFEGQNPDELAVADWEREYLLTETNRLFPHAHYTLADIEATTIGIRPLPASDQSAGAITRRHFLVDHALKHGISGLASIVGGKLTTYRSLAEEVTDWIEMKLEVPKPSPSHTGVIGDVLPLEALTTQCETTVRNYHLPASLVPILVYRYGPAYLDVLGRVKRDPSLGRPLGPNTPHIEAQVTHAVAVEFARTVEDVVRRRLMIVPPTEEALAGVRRVSEERGLGLKG